MGKEKFHRGIGFDNQVFGEGICKKIRLFCGHVGLLVLAVKEDFL